MNHSDLEINSCYSYSKDPDGGRKFIVRLEEHLTTNKERSLWTGISMKFEDFKLVEVSFESLIDIPNHLFNPIHNFQKIPNAVFFSVCLDVSNTITDYAQKLPL